MSDAIDRQAAIDAIEQHKTAVLGGREWDEGIAYGYAAAHKHLVDIVKVLPSVQPDNDMIHLQKEQAYLRGWEDGREALRKEMWEDGRDRLD